MVLLTSSPFLIYKIFITKSTGIILWGASLRHDAKGNELKRELSQDSTGVREFFAWAVQIFRVVYEDFIVQNIMGRIFINSLSLKWDLRILIPLRVMKKFTIS